MNCRNPVDTIVQYVRARRSITNRECRKLLDVTYDQAVFLLGEMCRVRLLMRKGSSSGTHYVLSASSVSTKAVAEFKERVMKRLL